METNEIMFSFENENQFETASSERFIADSALIDSCILKKRPIAECDEFLHAGFVY